MKFLGNLNENCKFILFKKCIITNKNVLLKTCI